MNKSALEKTLEHPDKDELIAKLIIGISEKDIHDWLKAKYTNANESKFVLAEKHLKSFKDNFLDLYTYIKNDVLSTKNNSSLPLEEQAILTVRNSKAYKEKMNELASGEIDIKKMIVNALTAIETRAGQTFDAIQDDADNFRNDRILMEWFDTLGSMIERYSKLVLQLPDQIIQHNITVQAVDQHINVLYEAIKELLSEMDLEASMHFMELFHEKISKLKAPTETTQDTTEVRLADAKILNQTINKRLNE